MKPRSTKEAYADMLDRLSDRDIINTSINAMDILDGAHIEKLQTHLDSKKEKHKFDYLAFLFSDAFIPDTHLNKNSKRVWPYMRMAFKPNELKQYQFTEEVFRENADSNIIRRAIILCAVGSELEADYYSKDLPACKVLIKEHPDHETQFLLTLDAICKPISNEKALHNRLEVLMECVKKHEDIQLAIDDLKKHLATSDMHPITKTHISDLLDLVISGPCLLNKSSMLDLIKAIKICTEDPSKANFEHIKEIIDANLCDNVDHDPRIDKIHHIAFLIILTRDKALQQRKPFFSVANSNNQTEEDSAPSQSTSKSGYQKPE